ncbi:MAG: hypothetical protein GWP91_05425 [Rhodobacterales bacterium]|nr:hypothetical protein [Rhodobacterales bacterium]
MYAWYIQFPFLTLLLGLSATASAQQLPVDIELVRQSWSVDAAPGLDAVLFAEDSTPQLHISEQYVRNPLVLDVFAADDPPQEVAVVNHRSTSTIAVTTAIGGRVAVGAALPVTVQWGTESETFGQDGVGLGNLQLTARSRLLTRGAYRLGARLDGALPVGATQMWTGGSPELSVASTHAVEWRGVTWMADTGLRLRTPLDTGANLVVGTEWLGGTGVRVAYGMIAVSTSVVGRLTVC